MLMSDKEYAVLIIIRLFPSGVCMRELAEKLQDKHKNFKKAELYGLLSFLKSKGYIHTIVEDIVDDNGNVEPVKKYKVTSKGKTANNQQTSKEKKLDPILVTA